jgi:glycosyltransferase involved in cell wall biosynthesis
MNVLDQTGEPLSAPIARGDDAVCVPALPAKHTNKANDSRPQPSVRVIIPALNEEKSIGAVLAALPMEAIAEVIVVDNNSTDNTAIIARQAGATVIRQSERGYGAACLAGIAAVHPRTDIIVFLDADFSDYPEDVHLLLAPLLAKKADFVLSTRLQKREARRALTPQQRWGNWLAVTLLRWRFGCRYSDLGPFRAISYAALKQLGMQDRNYGWTVEMQIRAVQQGLRIVEVPMRYRVRIGRSKISGTIKGTLLAGAKILYTIGKYWFA